MVPDFTYTNPGLTIVQGSCFAILLHNCVLPSFCLCCHWPFYFILLKRNEHNEHNFYNIVCHKSVLCHCSSSTTETLHQRHVNHATITAVTYIMVKECVNSKCIHLSFLTKLVLYLELYVDFCPPHNSPNVQVWPTLEIVLHSHTGIKWLFSVFSSPKVYSGGCPWCRLCTIIQHGLGLPMAKRILGEKYTVLAHDTCIVISYLTYMFIHHIIFCVLVRVSFN